MAGDTFLERARSTTFALLGTIVALGLLMVGLAVRQDWPLIGGAPLPNGGGAESGKVRIADAVSLIEGAPAAAAPLVAEGVPAITGSAAEKGGEQPRGRPGRRQVVAGSSPIARAPEPQPAPPQTQPEATPVAQPVGEEAVPVPAPATPTPPSAERPPATPARPGPVGAVGSIGGSQIGGGPGKSATRGRGAERRAGQPAPQATGGSAGGSSNGSSSGRGGGPPAGSGNPGGNGNPGGADNPGGGNGSGRGGGHGQSGR